MRNRPVPTAFLDSSADSAATSGTTAIPDDNLLGGLRQRFGLDLEAYRDDILRPLFARRMATLGIRTAAEYLALMESSSAEQAHLREALLVGSTVFFRDPLSFGMLRDYLTPIDVPEQGYRAWVPGCSSGQEAYSVAILLAEVLERRRSAQPVRVFATDVRPAALEQARRGSFHRSLLQQVSPERVRRWFIPDGAGYRVSSRLRQMVVFGYHDVLRDPPFARLDLISCRILLLYLRPEAQAGVLERFHFALRASGLLFLGSSESPACAPELFITHDREHRIYSKNCRRLRPPSFR